MARTKPKVKQRSKASARIPQKSPKPAAGKAPVATKEMIKELIEEAVNKLGPKVTSGPVKITHSGPVTERVENFIDDLPTRTKDCAPVAPPDECQIVTGDHLPLKPSVVHINDSSSVWLTPDIYDWCMRQADRQGSLSVAAFVVAILERERLASDKLGGRSELEAFSAFLAKRLKNNEDEASFVLGELSSHLKRFFKAVRPTKEKDSE